MHYKCCLTGGRRTSPRGFNHPPPHPPIKNHPHLESPHPSIRGSNEPRKGGRIADGERERQCKWGDRVVQCVCVCVLDYVACWGHKVSVCEGVCSGPTDWMRAHSIVSTGFFQLPLILGCFCTGAALHARLLPATSKKEAFQTQGEPPCQAQQSLLETTWHTVTSQLRPARWECEKASKQTEVLPEAQQYINSM